MKLCAHKFRSKITPETAADILLLADRHGLTALKQVNKKRRIFSKSKRNLSLFPDPIPLLFCSYTQETMAKIIAEKARYLENPDFKNKMTISLLTEMLAL